MTKRTHETQECPVNAKGNSRRVSLCSFLRLFADSLERLGYVLVVSLASSSHPFFELLEQSRSLPGQQEDQMAKVLFCYPTSLRWP